MEWLKKIHNYLLNKERIKSELYWIRKVWYILLLILTTIYVCSNFNKFVNQCFICRLDGNSLIFILWLILLLLPLLNSIEGYGFKFNKEQEEREEQTLKIKFLRDEILKENSIPKISELEEKLETIINDTKDE